MKIERIERIVCTNEENEVWDDFFTLIVNIRDQAENEEILNFCSNIITGMEDLLIFMED